jgi:2,3-bisphosphoglycerate-independent phosphoglycerate mutase
MNTLPRPRPLVVVILDGWGISLTDTSNAIAAADTPTMDSFVRHFPATSIVASGLEVGLPARVGGNSETGHRNIGAGRVEYQILAHIDQAIANESFFSNKALLGAFAHAEQNASDVHLIGLVSRGGVHSHLNHLVALLELAKRQGFKRPVYVHMFTDGRDSPPQSALTYLNQLRGVLGDSSNGMVASMVGRFYAMDRNNNWERTQATYNLLTGAAHAMTAGSAERAIERAYAEGVADEMIVPTAITSAGTPVASITDSDAVIFFNFRPDRARQLARSFLSPQRVPFTPRPLKNLYFATLTRYEANFNANAAFLERKAEYPLARVLADHHLKQLHIAETEKYAHITYYLNVGHEAPFPGEDRVLIESARVRDFAEKPEMAAPAITEAVLSALKRSAHDAYFINYANADMVGHTGNFAATVAACAFVDASLARLREAIWDTGGALLVTADHGKAEGLLPSEQQKKTEHTTNPVPLLYIRPELERRTARSKTEVAAALRAPVGVLADVAPTILDILHLPKPSTMSGVSLLGSMQ